MSVKVRAGVVAAALVVICVLEFLVVRPSADPARLRSLPLVAVAWVLFAGAAWLLRGLPVRWSVALILIGGIVIQVVAMSVPPQSSDDMYRYMWDGRVQAAGIDPYAYVPSAPQLAHLRDPFLWHAGALHCVAPGTPVPGQAGLTLTPGCTRINRPTVPTIYPPVAEAYFLALHYVTPVKAGSTPIQAAGAACAILVTVLLLSALRSMGRNVRLAALWAWCPTVALEAGNSAHVDVLAVAITAVALLVLARPNGGRRGAVTGGVLLGLAIATKMTPVLVGPAVLRRRWRDVVLATGGAVAVVYVPHVLAVGSKVVGFLPGYLQENGYNSGVRFGLIGLLVSGRLATVIAVLVLAGTALAVLRFSDPDRPWRGAVVMTGTALAVTTPSYQWYAILLVMLVVLDGHPEWLAFAAGGYLAAEPAMGRFTVPHPRAAGYGAAALFVAVVWVARQVSARRGRPAAVPAAASGPWPAPALTSPASPASPAAPATVTSVLAAEEQVINAPVLQSMIPATTQK
ncbi:MAG TPA: glycosyltransferase family 87 protein [Streptosporangiaceae bacterium]